MEIDEKSLADKFKDIRNNLKPQKISLKDFLCNTFIPLYSTSIGIKILYQVDKWKKPSEQIKGAIRAAPAITVFIGLDFARVYGYYKLGELISSYL